MKILTLAATTLTLCCANLAQAAPVSLSAAQMDGVSAGGLALAWSGSLTVGNLVSVTSASAHTVSVGDDLALAGARTEGIAVSFYGPAASVSVSQTVAILH